MTQMGYFDIFLAFFSLVVFCYCFRNKNGHATNWPIVGMIPALVQNLHRLHDYVVEVFENSKLTVSFKGPWFTKMHMLITLDPRNVHHILSKNFDNYHKGSKFVEIFDVFGETIITTDFDLWRYHRRGFQYVIGDPCFHKFFITKFLEKVETRLIPVLNHVAKQGMEVDLQDLLGRFTFDVVCTMTMDYDPRSLTIDMPDVPPANALDDVLEATLYRFVVPTCIWKFQRWLGVGKERQHKRAWRTLDTFIYDCIARKKEEIQNKGDYISDKENDQGADILTLLMDETRNAMSHNNKGDKLLRDFALSFLYAGRDTISIALSWFFYLLSKNPQVVPKIKEELNMITKDMKDTIGKDGQHNLLRKLGEYSDKLVYLHSALCESLRLYPPLPFEAKVAIEPDVLPSGHRVNPNTLIVLDLYAMGRMRSIWGDDCYEFRPERWISERGNLRHEPSYKFLAFMAGPRTCLGKHMAFMEMKIVAATILKIYDIQPIEDHPIVPDSSIVLRMKHGFKTKILSTSM